MKLAERKDLGIEVPGPLKPGISEILLQTPPITSVLGPDCCSSSGKASLSSTFTRSTFNIINWEPLSTMEGSWAASFPGLYRKQTFNVNHNERAHEQKNDWKSDLRYEGYLSRWCSKPFMHFRCPIFAMGQTTLGFVSRFSEAATWIYVLIRMNPPIKFKDRPENRILPSIGADSDSTFVVGVVGALRFLWKQTSSSSSSSSSMRRAFPLCLGSKFELEGWEGGGGTNILPPSFPSKEPSPKAREALQYVDKGIQNQHHSTKKKLKLCQPPKTNQIVRIHQDKSDN